MKHRRPTTPPQKPGSRALREIELDLVRGGAFPFIQSALAANDNR
jgi:hypothetical protein